MFVFDKHTETPALQKGQDSAIQTPRLTLPLTSVRITYAVMSQMLSADLLCGLCTHILTPLRTRVPLTVCGSPGFFLILLYKPSWIELALTKSQVRHNTQALKSSAS